MADGATLTTLLLSTSNILETYQETNPSPANPNKIKVNERGEWDWAIEDNNAPDSTTFFFRMVKDDGTELDTYVFYPELATPPPPVLTQHDYRWFQNVDSITPTPALVDENTAFAGATPLSVIRLRMNVGASVSNLIAGRQAFKLQYSTSTGDSWSDMGTADSAATWRFFDNPSVADGSTIVSVLLTASDTPESYQEDNPSVANPNEIVVNQRGEWDWVVQSNNATPDTFFFRMVREDGTPLGNYINFPTATTLVPVLKQQDYGWFENRTNKDPDTPLASENTPVTEAVPLDVFRLRVNVDVSGLDLPAGTQAFKLQYATSTADGPWTDVGAIGSFQTWRGFDNGGSTVDGATVATLLLTQSDVLESYEEENPSVLNPNAIATGQQGEWDWVIQNNSAPSGTFFFRMVRSGGTPLESYTNFPQLSTSGPTFIQEDYRWFENLDNKTPVTPLASENVAIVATSPGVVYRLRMNAEVGVEDLPAGGQTFKLQFSTDTGGSWTDVGTIGSAETWAGFDNPGNQAQDGATITPLLSTSDAGESYEENNPSVANPNPINVGQRGEWDWVVLDKSAAPNTTYFFRMAKEDGTPLDSYSRFPQLTTSAPLVLTQDNYRWFETINALDPVAPLAAENTPSTGATPLTVFRLRMNLGASGANLAINTQAFKLQYSNSTGGPWTDVGSIDSAETWRGFDNGGGGTVDGATITTLLLADSDVAETYEEANPSAPNPSAINSGQQGEWDWVLQNNTAPSGTFFFRMVRADGTELGVYSVFPEITTAAPFLTQRDYRWFENRANDTPVDPMAPENTEFTGGIPGTVYRIRMNVEVGSADLPADALAFKLQFSTSIGGLWTDVGPSASVVIWRGFDNANPAQDGATIGTLLSTSDVGESYEEENPSVLNPNAIIVGQRGEWDWVVRAKAEASDTTFFFRMVKNDGTPLDGYTNFPKIAMIPPVIAVDDFESGGTSGGAGWLGPWVLVGDASILRQGKAHQGSFHLRLRRDTGEATRSVDLTGKTDVRVQFWAKADSFEPGETAVFSVSTDGSSFTVLNTWVDGDDDGVYRFYDLSVSAGLLSSTFSVRFETDMVDAQDKFFVDEVQIVGT